MRAGVRAAGLLLVAAASASVGAEPRTELGRRFPVSLELSAARPSRDLPHCAPGDTARYMRARLRVLAGSPGRWYLTVRDASGRAVEVLTAGSFSGDGTHWTMRIPGCRLRFELQLAGVPPPPARIEVIEYLAMPERARNPYYSIQTAGHPRYQDLYAVPDDAVRILGDAVGMVMPSHRQVSWCCSGVAVGENLVLTNWHCGGPEGLAHALVWSDEICADTLVDFSWDGDGVSREFRCARVLALDEDLDFALLEVEPLTGQGPARPVVVRETPPVDGERLRLVHHPECTTKQITLNCDVARALWPSWTRRTPGVDLAHRCDTEEGSSGGAVLDAAGRLVALHHRGFARTTDQEAMAGRLNVAVRLDRILGFLDACTDATPRCTAGLRARVNVEAAGGPGPGGGH